MIAAIRVAGVIVLLLFLLLFFLSPDNAQAVIGWVIYGVRCAVLWIFSSLENFLAFFVVLVLILYFTRSRGAAH